MEYLSPGLKALYDWYAVEFIKRFGVYPFSEALVKRYGLTRPQECLNIDAK